MEVLICLGRKRSQNSLVGMWEFQGQDDGIRLGLRVTRFLGSGVQGGGVELVVLLGYLRMNLVVSL